MNGEKYVLALGKYPDLSLKDARTAHKEVKNKIAKGINPVIGNKIISEIEKGELVRIAKKIQDRGSIEMGNRSIEYAENKDPYYKMVSLIDDYIFDLELGFFDIAKEDKYIDSPIKPTRKELLDYLRSICKELKLENCVNNAKKLVVQLNKNC